MSLSGVKSCVVCGRTEKDFEIIYNKMTERYNRTLNKIEEEIKLLSDFFVTNSASLMAVDMGVLNECIDVVLQNKDAYIKTEPKIKIILEYIEQYYPQYPSGTDVKTIINMFQSELTENRPVGRKIKALENKKNKLLEYEQNIRKKELDFSYVGSILYDFFEINDNEFEIIIQEYYHKETGTYNGTKIADDLDNVYRLCPYCSKTIETAVWKIIYSDDFLDEFEGMAKNTTKDE
jgi:hypothetical protein